MKQSETFFFQPRGSSDKALQPSSPRVLAVVLLAACAIFSADLLAQTQSGSDIAGIAANEVLRRQQQVQNAQTLFTSGSRAFADRSYGEAMDYFKAAFESTPNVAATAQMRSAFFKRYQSSSLKFAEQLVEEAKFAEAQQTLEDAIQLADDSGMGPASIDPDLKQMLKNLKDGDYYNMANSPDHLRNVADVEKKLTVARGYLELGEYDLAERNFHRVLGIDRYNKAARMGLEEIERHRMNYLDVARNQTRATMLRRIAEGWEMPVPFVGEGPATVVPSGELPMGGKIYLSNKMQRIIIPSLEFEDASLRDVLDFLTQKSQELDTVEPDPNNRGVNIIVDLGPGGQDPSTMLLSVRLTNVPLAEALRYVVQQVGLKYRVDQYAVSVVPISSAESTALITRAFPVPPDFIRGGGVVGGGNAGGGNPDPFAPQDDDNSSTLVKRILPRDFLEQQGVQFPEGGLAFYKNGVLTVRTTADQMETVNNLVQSAKESGSKMVRVHVKMLSISEENAQQLGVDFLLGPGNLGSTPRTFFSGGTSGNATSGVRSADYPFVNPNTNLPVALTPVTEGLRTGSFGVTQSVEDVINRDQGNRGLVKAPGTFAVSGVFTDPQFQMVLRTLSQSKGVDKLCDAHVLVRPGQRAKFEQIREFIYPTEYDPPELPNQFGTFQIGNTRFTNLTTPTEFPITPATPTAFETRGLGKIIEVEPTVSSDNRTIIVNVLADFSEFLGFINYGTPIQNSIFLGGDGEPITITENEILMPVFEAVKETTNVPVWDGNTIVIGGFHGHSVTDTQDKIPYAGDLPLIGNVFRSSTENHNRLALLIFVSVRLVDPGDNPINPDVDQLAAQ